MVATSIQKFGTATTTSANPKPSGFTNSTRLSASAIVLANQILARDAQMRRSGLHVRCDFGGRDELDVDVGHLGDLAAITPGVAGFA